MKRVCFAVVLLVSVSCGDLTRQGTGSSYLTVETVEASSGASPAEFGGDLASDVITVVDGVPTVFSDSARVEFALRLKDAGSPSAPTSANAITVNRYRVQFVRTDGRNVQGVDVPYAFDGAFTVTVSSTATVGFTLVRVQAKREPPLAGIATNGTRLSTIAEITFYGHDQTGRAVITTARIGVNFGNFGDPA